MSVSNRFPLVWKLTAVALVAVLALPLVAAMSATDDGGKAEKVAKVLKGVKIPVAEAVKKAEKKTGGTAFGVELEVEKDRPIFEVQVLVEGDEPMILEVEVDAVTGKILEVEQDDDDDEDDDDDDDEDDDD